MVLVGGKELWSGRFDGNIFLYIYILSCVNRISVCICHLSCYLAWRQEGFTQPFLETAPAGS